jgi:hypothetical protein
MSTGWIWIKRYFSDLKTVLTQPTAFFRRVPLRGGLSGPLAFALITHWIGSAIEYLWQSAFGGMFAGRIEEALKQLETLPEVESLGRGAAYQQFRQAFLDWIWGTSSILLDPIWTVVSILWMAVFVFAGARLLITPGKDGAAREITFESAVRVVAYGMTPAIFRAVPGVGSLAAWIGTWVVTVIAAREIFRTTTTRAIFVGLFPQTLFLGIVLLLLFAVLALVFGFFAAVLN